MSNEDSSKADLKERLEERYTLTVEAICFAPNIKLNITSLFGECVLVIDYNMKLELGKRSREIQRDWYGKTGLLLHGCYVVAILGQHKRSSEVLDLWCDDTKQDAFFTHRGHFQDSLYTYFWVCRHCVFASEIIIFKLCYIYHLFFEFQ